MRFSLAGLVKGLILSALVCAVVFIGMRYFGALGQNAGDDPASLSRQAMQALEAVRTRQPGERRPPSYDMVLAPLDKLLRQARDTLQSANYNPATDFDAIYRLTAPVIDVAGLADAQAKLETGYLTKEYRFNDQKGEASFYMASALWERINALQPRNLGHLDEPIPLPAADMNRLRQILDAGIAAAPDNRDLYYLRGVVNRAEGLYAPAGRDLERAVELDPAYSAAWNTLGLVRIALREFDRAEEALERARVLSLEEARQSNTEPGAEYAAILYNLASFHEGLAAFYIRENRVNPTVEARRLMNRHVNEARKYLQEFIQREPADSPDAREAQGKLNALPQ